ncbi:MAG: hypothetical protein IT373_14845 [Polyangiaceae bacterium]|nr:hypothetical protein [Polyangiaceae bacterium]
MSRLRWLASLARRLRVLGVLGVLGPAACLSPTLPLPPPEAPDYLTAAAEPGVWRIGGTATAGAMVLVRNERTGVIVGVEDADGSYLVTVEAERCDTASVFEVLGTHASESTYFIVRETVNGVPQDAPCTAPP